LSYGSDGFKLSIPDIVIPDTGFAQQSCRQLAINPVTRRQTCFEDKLVAD